MKRASLFAVLTAACGVLAGTAECAAEGDWDVTLARGRTTTVDFTTREGTWMSVDPSPDGRWLVFDLLANVYRLPVEGGDAECLTCSSGVAVNYHPRYSPDGRLIAFISDRSGQDNLWVMAADGTDPRPVRLEDDARHSQPVWDPDGRSLIVRRTFFKSQQQWARENGLWRLPLDGGEPVELIEDDEPGAGWPSISADGRYLFFHVFLGDDHPVGHAATLEGYWQLRRRDLETHETVQLTPGLADQQARTSSGGAFAPEISPDGRHLAFARQIPAGTISYRGHRFGPRTALWLRDLETGTERMVMDPISKDLSEGEGFLRVVPGYGWSDDGRAIYLSQGGGIRRLDVATGEVRRVPFEARVVRQVSEPARGDRRLVDVPFRARMIRWPTMSPDRRRLAFEAVGRIWILDAVSGEPTRLTGGEFDDVFELAPAWSSDGRWIAFTTSEGRGGGHLWKVDSTGWSPPVRLTTTRGEYLYPVWSPDDVSVVVTRGTGATARGRGMIANHGFELVRVPAEGGVAEVVASMAGAQWESYELERRQIPRASFGPDGRIFFPQRVRVDKDGEETSVVHLVSVSSSGGDFRRHLGFRFADDMAVSPDGSMVAFQEGDNVYVAGIPAATGPTPGMVERRGGVLGERALSENGGLFPRWLDRNTVEFGGGPRHMVVSLDDGGEHETEIRLEVPRPTTDGRIALTNARLVTLGASGRIERGHLVVEDGRIACIGVCETGGSDRIIDAAGRTIIPGLIDSHVHNNVEHRGVIPPVNPETAAYLAFGVTTVHEPSAWAQNVFTTAELIETGRLIGPRTFSTGDPLFRGDGDRHNRIDSLSDAHREIDRLASWGAISIKEYYQPRRQQRQWIAEAARRKRLMLTGESNDLAYNLGMILDGHKAWEHPLGPVPVYGDVARFFGLAGATYSATLGVGGPGVWNEELFFEGRPPLWMNEKLRRFIPWRQLVPHTRRPVARPMTDYSYPMVVEGIKDILAAGGNAAVGSHGQQHGIALHWEVWMLASVLGPHQALEVACLGGARFLGVERDLGSLDVGKIADLLVLGSNPLEDIRSTTDIELVMKGGILWRADELAQLWPIAVEPPDFVIDRWMLEPSDLPLDYWDAD